MIKLIDQHHIFSVYFEQETQQCSKHERIVLNDKSLYHRLIRVLRLTEDDVFIIFDRYHHFKVRIQSIKSPAMIECAILTKNINKKLQPDILFLLPLLKREALEQAMYSCIELGASDVILFPTAKSQKLNQQERLQERLTAISIAAAEQSKNYRFPEFSFLSSIDEIFTLKKGPIFFATPDGLPMFEVIQKAKAYTTLSLLVGPEGDFTTQEKNILKKNGAHGVRLTPTILRSQQAVALLLGIFRSMLV